LDFFSFALLAVTLSTSPVGLTLDERISRLETENEALRTHLRLALSTIKDPIPETLYLSPTEEEMAIAEDWDVSEDGDIFENDEWDDCWGVLLAEAEGLAGEVGKWREEYERDLREWRGAGGPRGVAVEA
jgi:hypothetical protein